MTANFPWYNWMAITALAFCLTACMAHFIRLVRLGSPADLSRPAGNPMKGIRHAFTGAMNPKKKESAYLHLPTYSAGLMYHLGNFMSFILFFFILAGNKPTGGLSLALAVFLSISVISGISILVKRMVVKNLRSLSNPDDYISNILVTLFQLLTLIVLLHPSQTTFPFPSSPLPLFPSSPLPVLQSYYIIFTLLALYIPVGKLRHTVYFFAARYHLGYFFGFRGIWPSKNIKI